MTSAAPDLERLINEFVAESVEGLDMAVDDVMFLEREPDREAIDRIFRVVHTIKGTAGMFSFDALSRFVHCLEDVCSDIRSGDRDVDRQAADGLLKCLDFIRARLDAIRDTHQDEECSEGEECLRALQGCTAGRAASSDMVEAPCDTLLASHGMDKIARMWGGSRCRVLIVEDDFAARSRLYSFLSRFMDCSVAKDGSEAIQAVTESYIGQNPMPFSLIIMSAELPIIDGLRATKAIRALERAKGAGLTHPQAGIFITASTGEYEIRRQAIHVCGADNLVVKPLDCDKVTRLLANHQQAVPASEPEYPEQRRCA